MTYLSERKQQHHFSVSHLYCKTVQSCMIWLNRNKDVWFFVVLFWWWYFFWQKKICDCKLEESLCQFSGLFPSQLLIQPGDVGVPLGLVAGPGHGCSKVILHPEVPDLKFCTAVPRAVGEGGLGAGQGTRLLIDQPHVPMETLERGEWQVLNYSTGKYAHIQFIFVLGSC